MEEIKNLSSKELLKFYAGIIDELRCRGIIRTKNNPVGDYAEWLVKTAFGYELQINSKAGFDAIDQNCIRYQIKSRRITKDNKSTQLSVIRNLDREDFDFLVAILFDSEFRILKAIKLPHSTIHKYARHSEHVNGHLLRIRSNLLADSSVVDITDILKKVEV